MTSLYSQQALCKIVRLSQYDLFWLAKIVEIVENGEDMTEINLLGMYWDLNEQESINNKLKTDDEDSYARRLWTVSLCST